MPRLYLFVMKHYAILDSGNDNNDIVFRSRGSTHIQELLRRRGLSQRAWWSLSPTVDSSDGGLTKTVIWTLTRSKLSVRCHLKCNVDIIIISFHLLLIHPFFSTTSLFQGAVWFMLDAARPGPSLHLLQEVSSCPTALQWWAGIIFVFECATYFL